MATRIDRRQKRVEELHRLLVESVEAVQSTDDWKRLLDFAGRFHIYSFDNQCLIAVQHEHAYRAGRVGEPLPTYVAGFHTWKASGRSVNKGQRGYAILAPMTGRSRFARAADGSSRPLARGEHIDEDERFERGPKALKGFTIAHVWDVSQTSGAPIPKQPRPQLLQGQAPDGLAEGLTAFLTSRGFEVTSVADADAIGGANGLTEFGARKVRVRADMDPAARVKTLAHEAGHVLLHDLAADPNVVALGPGHRGEAEVEAESVAYVVTSACGMDSSGYSLPYVTAWAGNNQPADIVRSTAHRVVGAARSVLSSLQIAPAGTPAVDSLSREPRRAERPVSVDTPQVDNAIGLQ